VYDTDRRPRDFLIRLTDTRKAIVVSFVGSSTIVGFVGSSMIVVGSNSFGSERIDRSDPRLRTRPLERFGIWLCSLYDILSSIRIGEYIWIICWILGLIETIEYRITRTFLTKQ
jgi:hypothetical protein